MEQERLLDQLRTAVRQADVPLLQLSERADLRVSTLERFMAGADLPLSCAENLADALGMCIRLLPDQRRRTRHDRQPRAIPVRRQTKG